MYVGRRDRVHELTLGGRVFGRGIGLTKKHRVRVLCDSRKGEGAQCEGDSRE